MSTFTKTIVIEPQKEVVLSPSLFNFKRKREMIIKKEGVVISFIPKEYFYQRQEKGFEQFFGIWKNDQQIDKILLDSRKQWQKWQAKI